MPELLGKVHEFTEEKSSLKNKLIISIHLEMQPTQSISKSEDISTMKLNLGMPADLIQFKDLSNSSSVGFARGNQNTFSIETTNNYTAIILLSFEKMTSRISISIEV